MPPLPQNQGARKLNPPSEGNTKLAIHGGRLARWAQSNLTWPWQWKRETDYQASSARDGCQASARNNGHRDPEYQDLVAHDGHLWGHGHGNKMGGPIVFSRGIKHLHARDHGEPCGKVGWCKPCRGRRCGWMIVQRKVTKQGQRLRRWQWPVRCTMEMGEPIKTDIILSNYEGHDGHLTCCLFCTGDPGFLILLDIYWLTEMIVHYIY